MFSFGNIPSVCFEVIMERYSNPTRFVLILSISLSRPFFSKTFKKTSLSTFFTAVPIFLDHLCVFSLSNLLTFSILPIDPCPLFSQYISFVLPDVDFSHV